MNLKWEKYLSDVDNIASDEGIKKFETEHQIVFPPEYIDLVKAHQGEVPGNFVVNVGKGITPAGVLFHFDKSGAHTGYSIEKVLHNIQDEFPENVIPFQSAGGGCHFAFNYRENSSTPSIIFIDSDYEGDEAIIPIADNFTEFLYLLYESKD